MAINENWYTEIEFLIAQIVTYKLEFGLEKDINNLEQLKLAYANGFKYAIRNKNMEIIGFGK